MPAAALEESIKSAMTQLDEGDDKTPDTKTPDTSIRTKESERTSNKSDNTDNERESDDEPEKDEETDSSDLSDEEIVKAKELFKALKDPEQAASVVDFLATKAGYTKAPETKTEAKEQAKDIIAKLKEAAGDELGFLIDKIGPVIKEELESQVDSVRNELRSTEARRENEKLVSDTKVAITDLAQKYYKKDEFPKEIYKDMTALMDKLQPSADMKPADYIEMLYFTVAGKKGISVNQDQSKRVDRNREDAPSRLASQRGVKSAEKSDAPKKMDLNQSIRAAMEQLEKGEG